MHRMINQAVLDALGHPDFINAHPTDVVAGAVTAGGMARHLHHIGNRPYWSDEALEIARNHVAVAEAQVEHELLALPLP